MYLDDLQKRLDDKRHPLIIEILNARGSLGDLVPRMRGEVLSVEPESFDFDVLAWNAEHESKHHLIPHLQLKVLWATFKKYNQDLWENYEESTTSSVRADGSDYTFTYRFLDSHTLGIFEDWHATGCKVPYLTWLEERVIAYEELEVNK